MRRLSDFFPFVACMLSALILAGASCYAGGESRFILLEESSLSSISGMDVNYSEWESAEVSCLAAYEIPAGYVTDCDGEDDGTDCIICDIRTNRFTVTPDEDGEYGADQEANLPCNTGDEAPGECEDSVCVYTPTEQHCNGYNVPSYIDEE
jgi:hypothetical protein